MQRDDLVNNSTESEFDRDLRAKWTRARENGAFRYELNIRSCKTLAGKYRILAQLNEDRGRKRRNPQNIRSMRETFDENGFNFTQLKAEEEIANFRGDLIAINASPFEFCHSLLLPRRDEKLPQIATRYSLFKVVELFSLSSSRYLRACFNSLCAHASVNHLHWHIYYLQCPMLLEYIDLDEFAGPVKILTNYPAKAFCVKHSDAKNTETFVNYAFSIIDHLQNAQIAHNVFITRSELDKNQGNYSDLRIYIWARRKTTGSKNSQAFNAASCEFFGHLSVKTEELFEALTEDFVAKILREETEDSFNSVCTDIKTTIDASLDS